MPVRENMIFGVARQLRAFMGTGVSAWRFGAVGRGLMLIGIVLSYVKECQVRRWILPRDEPPFSMGSYYNDVQIFNADFREAFHARYRIIGISEHFATWECQPRLL
jgi:hypothetical protein